MNYRTSSEAPGLMALMVNVDLEVSQAHPTMVGFVRIACERHNRAIELLAALGDFAKDWDQPVDDAGIPIQSAAYEPGVFAVPVDSLTIELKSRQSPHTMPDMDLVRHRVGVIAQADKNHPVARHWKVLRDRCTPASYEPVSWPEIEALLA